MRDRGVGRFIGVLLSLVVVHMLVLSASAATNEAVKSHYNAVWGSGWARSANIEIAFDQADHNHIHIDGDVAAHWNILVGGVQMCAVYWGGPGDKSIDCAWAAVSGTQAIVAIEAVDAVHFSWYLEGSDYERIVNGPAAGSSTVAANGTSIQPHWASTSSYTGIMPTEWHFSDLLTSMTQLVGGKDGLIGGAVVAIWGLTFAMFAIYVVITVVRSMADKAADSMLSRSNGAIGAMQESGMIGGAGNSSDASGDIKKVMAKRKAAVATVHDARKVDYMEADSEAMRLDTVDLQVKNALRSSQSSQEYRDV